MTTTIVIDPPEGSEPRPPLPPITPSTEPVFDPTDPDDLELLAKHLMQRSGRAYRIPDPFEVPTDSADPATEWQTYPEHPAIRHHERTTRTVIDVSFPTADSFRLLGWVWEGQPAQMRPFDRTGRFYNVGAASLAIALAPLIETELAGGPPHGCTGPRRSTESQ